jgi:hypothetical protein
MGSRGLLPGGLVQHLRCFDHELALRRGSCKYILDVNYIVFDELEGTFQLHNKLASFSSKERKTYRSSSYPNNTTNPARSESLSVKRRNIGMANCCLEVAGGHQLEHKRGPESLHLVNDIRVFIKEREIRKKILSEVTGVSVIIPSHKVNDDGDGGRAEIAAPLREALIGLKLSA